MSFTTLSLRDAFGVPPTRIPVDAPVFVSYILPVLVCYLAVAVLVLMPQTRTARVALWPVFVLLALRAAVSVSISNGKPELRIYDGYFTCAMFVLSARTLEWALERELLVRQLRPANSSPSIIMDALDLTINLRGYGWNWSHGFSFPQDTRPKNRFPFALHVILSTVGHLLMFGICQRAIISFRPLESTATVFGLFDKSLPLFLQYIRASIIVAFQYVLSYSSSQTSYNIGTIIGVLFFGQEPAQWPPLFDAPWRSTSLTEYWGRRWHQWFRHTFLFLGGYPLARFIGPPGIFIGGFLASAVMHGVLVVGGGNMEAARATFLALAMMSPLGLAERAFYRLTGKKVGGVAGAIWTVVWLQLAGIIIFDGWMKAGAMDDKSLIDGIWPVRMLVERSVKGIDALLRAI